MADLPELPAWVNTALWAEARKEGYDQPPPPKANGHVKDPEPFRTIRASEWHGQPVPQVEFLDKRKLIPMGYSTIFTGAAGVGKTYVALQAAIASAAGLPWLGSPIKKGPSLFYSAEENLDVLHMRTARICFAENIHLDRLDDLHFIDLADVINASLINGDNRTGSARTTDLYTSLDITMGDVKPVSVWLDNRGLLVTGNENDRTIAATAMRAFQLLAGKHDCAVTMLSHPSNAGINSGTGASGSTGWFSGGRSVLNLTTPEEGGDDVRILDNNKTNYSTTGTKVNLKWQMDRYICTDKPVSPDEAIGKVDKSERVFLKLLRLLTEQGLGNDLSPLSNANSNYAPKVFEAHPGREGLNRKWFKMAMESLLARKIIEIAERGPPSRRIKFIREVPV